MSGRGVRSSVSSSGSLVSSKAPTRTRQERQTNFKVVIRVRPPLPRELGGDVPFQNIVAVDDREQVITVSENLDAVLDEEGQVVANPGPYTTHTFVFDYVYDQTCTQRQVYETTAKPVVDCALQGYNATIFAYGQTGTGKTFTMEGFNRDGGIEARGIIPRAIEQIFGHIQKFASPRMRFLVRASYLQIYNEQISDLLKPERSNLTIREDKRRGVYVEGLSEWVVRSPAEIYGLMERGGAIRATGETKMNELSSRSHAVFIVIAEQSETTYVDDNGVELTAAEFQKFVHSKGIRREQDMKQLESHVRQSFKVGKLNLVDLAGSERVRLSGATGQRLEESKQINRSLAALGNVISALTEAKSRAHIPYRDSKLTRMLEDSLGGNCKTTMMAMISPAFEAMQETVSTLKFANRAKNIRNEARVNEDLDQKSLLRKYERELKKLRAELEERSKNVVDKRRVLELEERHRRAEADKMVAIRALEARSVEFMREKEEKRKLEERIFMLQGQVIRGDKDKDKEGGAGLKEQQEKLSQEYQFKLADLERERETIEEEKAQVDRYKQLLLKQRDIMIALTQRLVERDEQIMGLQDELDAYDSHHKELEEKLDAKTALLIKFQRISMEQNDTSPVKSEELKQAMEVWSAQPRQASGPTEVLDDDDSSQSRGLIDGLRAKVVELEGKLRSPTGNPSSGAEAAEGSNTDDARVLGVGGGDQKGGMIKALKEENARLKARNVELEVRSTNSAASAVISTDPEQLQAKVNSLVKEREAVQTIMEHKIKVLVQSVAQSAAAVGPCPASVALSKDLISLQRLVNASIAALRNAAAANPGTAPAPVTAERGARLPLPVVNGAGAGGGTSY
mmetsp:Transcript_1675/g.3912  ORF Transcript_1675/g.3912 Transcript_1675/m.3912 type:complete len:854 (-) Transcript_1675:171-2732(-)